MKNKPTIIPIASGKGGVGKSILAANLSISLARLGCSVVVVDLDLGASNLNTYLGVSNNYPGIGDYLKTGDMRFGDLLVQTSIPNLRFLPGDGRIPFMANITYEQRRVLLREIRRLSVDYIILDLGAGSQFNTLNFFGLTPTGFLLTTFETPAIMNFIMFLRNFMLRELSSSVRKNKQVVAMLKAQYNQPMAAKPLTVSSLIRKIRTIDPQMAEHAVKTIGKYRPRIIFNMVDTPDDLAIIPKIDNILNQGLSVHAEFFGCIFYDEIVRMASRKKKVLALQYQESIVSKSISHIAGHILEKWKKQNDNSVQLLMDDTRDSYSRWTHVKKESNPAMFNYEDKLHSKAYRI